MGRLLRVLLGDDAVVEVETPEDAVRLVQLYKHARLADAMFPGGTLQSAVSFAPDRRVTATPPKPSSKPKSPTRAVFSNGHYEAFLALTMAGNTGLTTEDLMKALGVTNPKSVPPTVAAWGKRARAAGLDDFRELFEVERGYTHGKPQTIYRLTLKGREVFQPEPEKEQTQPLGL
jgi:hypothetical protein